MESRDQFVRFVQQSQDLMRHPEVEALASYYDALNAAEGRPPARPASDPISGPLPEDGILVREPRATVLQLDWDAQQIIDGLQRGEPAKVTRIRKHYRIDRSESGVRQLVEIAPLAAVALELCDGTRTVKEFIAEMAPRFEWTR